LLPGQRPEQDWGSSSQARNPVVGVYDPLPAIKSFSQHAIVVSGATMEFLFTRLLYIEMPAGIPNSGKNPLRNMNGK
jgi:hypothetical protein